MRRSQLVGLSNRMQSVTTRMPYDTRASSLHPTLMLRAQSPQ
jgi:hypothetical protein